jgi:hypothetical protein
LTNTNQKKLARISGQRKEKMKKLIGILFVFAICLTGCGVSVNGEDVAKVDNPLDNSIIFKQCDLIFKFSSAIDETAGDEYWKYVAIENHDDQGARVWIRRSNGGYVINDGYIGANSKDFRKEIYVDMNDSVEVHTERPNVNTGDWEQCDDDSYYTLK